MPTNTLLTLGCGDCHTCGNVPPECKCTVRTFFPNASSVYFQLFGTYAGFTGCCDGNFPPAFGGFDAAYLNNPISDGCTAWSTEPQFFDSVAKNCVTDSLGNIWRTGGRTFLIWSAIANRNYDPTQQLTANNLDFHFVPYTVVTIRQDYYANSSTQYKASQIWEYWFETCECLESFTIDPADLKSTIFWNYVSGSDFSPPDCKTTESWSSIVVTTDNSCTGDCSANCCTDLGTSGITSVNFDIVASGLPAIFAFSSCDAAYSATVNVANTGSCEWTWALPAPGSPPPDCFTDSAAENWYFNEKRIEITSTNSAGTPPCTMLKFVMEYVRSSDSAVASQYWNFDFNYCDVADIPTGTPLSLSSTSHDFPNGAPGFRSVSITPN